MNSMVQMRLETIPVRHVIYKKVTLEMDTMYEVDLISEPGYEVYSEISCSIEDLT